MKQLIHFLLIFLSLTAGPVQASAWLDTDKSASERTELLLEAMTLEEKVAMMHGVCRFEIPGCGFTIGKVPANQRLGIPALHMTDGPAGVRNGQPATSFPAPVAIAASWNTGLAYDVASAIGVEALARGQDVLLSPMINVVRVPLAGRNFETFGEDPYLLSRMAVAHIRGVQDQRVMANAKHYILNNQEWDRRRMTVTADERTIREIYLPAFAAAVEEADVASMMCSYNRADGVHVCHSEKLLRKLLRDDLGFNGFVVTDWNALRDSDATPLSAISAGLNVVMPWPKGDVYGPPFSEGKPLPGPGGSVPLAPLVEAVRTGKVDEKLVDALVGDTLRAMFRFGLFERIDGPRGDMPFEQHRELSRRAAEQGAVLLKNQNNVLPLKDSETVAVIGGRAFRANIGGGGSSAVQPYFDPVSPLDALHDKLGRDSVRSARGIEELPGHVPVQEAAWTHGLGLHGINAEYYANMELDGAPVLERVEPRIAFDWDRFSPQAEVPVDRWSARFSGMLTAPLSGEYELDLVRAGAARAWLDGKLLFDGDSWEYGNRKRFTTRIKLEAGRQYEIAVEFFDLNQRRALLKIGWEMPGRDLRGEMIQAAVGAAAKSDTALVFVGDPASEGSDRTSLSLGEASNQLVDAVADANPRTVVVLSSGAPVEMPWVDKVAAVLLMWYPGQEDGNAVAKLLTGGANPVGKLPVTFGKRIKDYPASTSRQYPGVAPAHAPDETWKEAVYSEGVFVGYRHFDFAGIEPLFAFGHGLSYTTFAYGDTRIEPNEKGDGWTVSLSVENTGSVAGAEVVQFYVASPGQAVPRPLKELKSFIRVELQPGEKQRVSTVLKNQSLSYWDVSSQSWTVEPGRYQVLIGASSRDIRARLTFELRH